MPKVILTYMFELINKLRSSENALSWYDVLIWRSYHLYVLPVIQFDI